MEVKLTPACVTPAETENVRHMVISFLNKFAKAIWLLTKNRYFISINMLLQALVTVITYKCKSGANPIALNSPLKD
jgi:hypothetical protein